MQEQKHKATQCLRCCQIRKGLWEGQHHYEELWRPPESDVHHWRFSFRGEWWCHNLNLAVGEPKPGNLTQIHDEVMKKLESMVYAQQHDAHIGGYPISFCCEPATLCQIYTMEELRATGVIIAMTPSANPVTFRQPAGSEFEEWHYWHWGPLQSGRRKHGNGVADSQHPYDHQWQGEGLAQSSHQGTGPCHKLSCEASPGTASGGGMSHHWCLPTPRGRTIQS